MASVKKALVCILVFVSCCLVFGWAQGSQHARGWGDSIDWVSDLEEAKRVARIRHHPILVLIHKKWCGACKSLKNILSQSDEFAKASKNLVMVNLEDDMEPNDVEYKPDGAYIPRVIFLDPKGNVKNEVMNQQGSNDYRYYYPRPEPLIDSMNRAVQLFHIDHLEDTEDTSEPFVDHNEL